MIGTLLVAFSACKKSPEHIGNNLLDGNDYIDLFRTDTVAVQCHSYFDDSIGTKNVSLGLLGSMKDPVFGNTEAGFYTQFHISSAGQNYGAHPVLDSLVMQLYIAGYYGDTTTWQTVHAYELTDSLSVEENYCNSSEVAHSTIDHANGYMFKPHPKSNHPVVGNDTLSHAILRIPLSSELGNYLMNLDTIAYSEPDVFKNHFKGLYLTCDPTSTGGAVTSLNLTNNSLTSLQLYYHDEETPGKAMRYDFYITSSDVYFNHFNHDYTQGSPEFVQQLLDGDTTLGQQQLYLQTTAGVRARVRFPNVEHWADTLSQGHIVINEAKLVLPASPAVDDSSSYPSPSTLVALGFNEDGTTYLLPDYYEGTSYFGGTYSSASRSVTFRVTEYLQGLVSNKKPNVGLSIGINGAAYNASRWIINGPDATEGTPLKLIVTYSIVNE